MTADKERGPLRQKNYQEDLQRIYPEPIPRARIFSMLMFPEYATKLADAYVEMSSNPETQSCVNELFIRFCDSIEGCRLYCEACVEIAKSENGRQVKKLLCKIFTYNSIFKFLV